MMKRNAWVIIKVPQVLEHFLLQLLDILWGVFIFSLFYIYVQFELREVGIVKPIIFGDRTLDILTQCYSSLIGPTTGNILNSISTSSQHHQRNSIRFHLFNTLSMASYAQIQSP